MTHVLGESQEPPHRFPDSYRTILPLRGQPDECLTSARSILARSEAMINCNFVTFRNSYILLLSYLGAKSFTTRTH